jgi:hypothetical protein
MSNILDSLIRRLADDSGGPVPRYASPRIKTTEPVRGPDPTEPSIFFKYLLRLAAIRCGMASWGQPLEAILAAFLLARPKPR